MKKLSLTLILLLIVSTISAQSTKIWLTINDDSQIRSLQSKFNLSDLKKALPDSKMDNLKKVYEIEINGDYSSFIKYINETNGISTLK